MTHYAKGNDMKKALFLFVCICLWSMSTPARAEPREEYIEVKSIRASSFFPGNSAYYGVLHPYNSIMLVPGHGYEWAPDFSAPGFGEREEWIQYDFKYEMELSGLVLRFKDERRGNPQGARAVFSDGAGIPLAWNSQAGSFSFPPKLTTSLRIVLQPSDESPRPKLSEVRVVSGEKTLRMLLAKTYVPARSLVFSAGRGIAVDVVNGLVWPFGAEKLSLPSSKADAACAARRYGGLSGWMLPDLDQLDTLRKSSETHDFPNKRKRYLSGTFDKDRRGRLTAAAMDFSNGAVHEAYDKNHDVLCVRPDAKAGDLLLDDMAWKIEGVLEWSAPAPSGGPGWENGKEFAPDPKRGFLPAFYGFTLAQATSVLGRELIESAHSALDGTRNPASQALERGERQVNRIKSPHESYAEFQARVAGEEEALKNERRAAGVSAAHASGQGDDLTARQESQVYLGAAHRALHRMYGSPVVRMNYDADAETFAVTVYSTFGDYRHTFSHPVPRKYARKLKYWMGRETAPTVLLALRNGNLEFRGVKELMRSELFVETRELEAAGESPAALEAFIREFPDSSLLPRAQSLLAKLEEEALAERQASLDKDSNAIKKQRAKQKALVAAQDARKRALALGRSKKSGQILCKGISTDFGLSEKTIRAEVIAANEESIWLRISDNSHTLSYLGQTPRDGDVLMDSPYAWMQCE